MSGNRESQLMTAKEYSLRLKTADKKHGNRNLNLVGPYLGMCTKATHQCKDCEYTWDVLPRNLVNRLQGCPNCGPQKRKPAAVFVDKLNGVHAGDIHFEANPASTRLPRDVKRPRRERLGITAKCLQCKHVWAPAYHNSIRGHGCPICAFQNSFVSISSPHQAIINLLASKKIKHEVNDRRQLKTRELDLWLPDHYLGIEINGVYWHSEKFVDKQSHYLKALACKTKNIKLLQFWDSEIKDKPKIVASVIQAHVGKSKVVYARKLRVERVAPMLARSWFQENHLQGPVNSTCVYGLVDRTTGKVMCAMSFGKPRFSKHEWELIRFANLIGHTVVGGASRLLAAFATENSPQEIVSYADLRYSQGNMYKMLGFELSHRSQPNYFYVGRGKRISRYAAQKHKLINLLGEGFDASKTEKENMLINGYYKVFDAGNLVYVKRFNPHAIETKRNSQ